MRQSTRTPFRFPGIGKGFECPEFSHILVLGASRGARGGVEFLYGRHWKGVGMEAHKLRLICSVCDAGFLLK